MGFPNFPGIPPLLNSSTTAAVALVASPIISGALDKLSQKWGVYDASGKQVLTPDSFLEHDYVNASNIPTFPQEQGAFAAYSKVQTPRDHSVTVTKGGSNNDMSAFQTTLETLANGTDLYTIVTPSKSFTNVNIDKCEYRRTAVSGAGMIIATLHLLEIRQASAKFSQPGAPSATATASPTAQASVSNGQVYTQAAPSVTPTTVH